MCFASVLRYSYFWIKPRLIFSFHLCLRLTSPNYAFMRHRLYSKRKVKEYYQFSDTKYNFCINLLNQKETIFVAFSDSVSPFYMLPMSHFFSNSTQSCTGPKSDSGQNYPFFSNVLIKNVGFISKTTIVAVDFFCSHTYMINTSSL